MSYMYIIFFSWYLFLCEPDEHFKRCKSFLDKWCLVTGIDATNERDTS